MSKLLILGRSRRVVEDAAARLRDHGCAVDGVTTDGDALAALDTGRYSTLLIGGGVEKLSHHSVGEVQV